MARLRVGVVGVGHLGKEHARILASLPDVELVGVVDPNVSQVEMVAQRCGTRAFRDHHANRRDAHNSRNSPKRHAAISLYRSA